MTTPIVLALGAAYFIGLIALGIYTATLRIWAPYITGAILFVVVLCTGLFWSVAEEDGPSGFAVLAAHGLIFWVAVLAHAIRWIRVLIAKLRRSSAQFKHSNP